MSCGASNPEIEPAATGIPEDNDRSLNIRRIRGEPSLAVPACCGPEKAPESSTVPKVLAVSKALASLKVPAVPRVSAAALVPAASTDPAATDLFASDLASTAVPVSSALDAERWTTAGLFDDAAAAGLGAATVDGDGEPPAVGSVWAPGFVMTAEAGAAGGVATVGSAGGEAGVGEIWRLTVVAGEAGVGDAGTDVAPAEAVDAVAVVVDVTGAEGFEVTGAEAVEMTGAEGVEMTGGKPLSARPVEQQQVRALRPNSCAEQPE